MRGAPHASTARMIVSAAIGKRPATYRAQRMADELNAQPARGTKILRVPAVHPACARAAARREKPVHDPIEMIRRSLGGDELHMAVDLSKTPALWRVQPDSAVTNESVFSRDHLAAVRPRGRPLPIAVNGALPCRPPPVLSMVKKRQLRARKQPLLLLCPRSPGLTPRLHVVT
jgi:hypothetical protein